MAAMRHPSENGALTSEKVLPGSNRKVWWLCSKCNQEWEESVSRRTNKKGFLSVMVNEFIVGIV
jgi:hypothetical protein